MYVKPKKHLGQHFLKDDNIARKTVESLLIHNNYTKIMEIGAGTGVLTKHLFSDARFETFVIDVDKESIEFLNNIYPDKTNNIIYNDFLKINLNEIFDSNFGIIGNFPYNISTQILFKVLEYRAKVDEVVGMFQKEVAERIASKHGNKVYGILSVLLQAFYKIEYLFTVNETVFSPPPKVKSAVIRLTRNDTKKLDCNEQLFFSIVKKGFNQRRKTLRNSLKEFLNGNKVEHEFFNKRAEQLSVQDFVELTNLIEGLSEKK